MTEEIRNHVEPAAQKTNKKEARSVIRFTARAFILCLLFFVVVFVVAFGAHAYATYAGGKATDTRPCSFTLGNTEITGVRTYSYPFHEVLGFRFIDTKSIEERTQIDVRGYSVTVIGQTKTEGWFTYVGQGEQGIQKLEAADTYSFVLDEGKSAGFVSYKAFCL